MTTEEKTSLILETLTEIPESEVQRIREIFAEDNPVFMEGSVEEFLDIAAYNIAVDGDDFDNGDIKDILKYIKWVEDNEEDEDEDDEYCCDKWEWNYNPLEEIKFRASLE